MNKKIYVFRASVLSVFATAMLLCWGCPGTPKRAPDVAFYHWKTSWRPSAFERQYLRDAACGTLYIKCLDIAARPERGDVGPVSMLQVADTLPDLNKVACIFIKNDVFKGISTEKSAKLVQNIARYLRENAGFAYSEVQVDCDWTGSTRAAYFQFLKELKHALGDDKRLSATIRLHQYKFPEETGVPPVDRGMLMLYNTGDIDDPATGNSIFEPLSAEQYLTDRMYPIPLDLALPLFQWGLVFREGELWKIVDGISEAALTDTARFERYEQAENALGVSRYLTRQNTFLSGHFLRPGDVLRLESIPPELLQMAAGVAQRITLAQDARVAFFDLDSATCTRYDPRMLRALPLR
jgi:hypothetical protein